MKTRRAALLLYIVCVLMCVTGCNRDVINQQVAEVIGTVGMYENGEPVETPKMKADKEIQKLKDEIEKEVSTHVENAEKYAASYDYEKAMEELNMISEEHQDERVVNAMLEYNHLQKRIVNYTGTIPHFSVDRLATDPTRAYSDPAMGYSYNRSTITTDEFRRILQSLYDRDYIMLDIEDIVIEEVDEKGKVSLIWKTPTVPEGKKPFILSVTEADYIEEGTELGFTTRMVLDEDGNVQVEYLDASGNTITGAYDAITILNEFVEKHPDFSMHGARGIIAVQGYTGLFGYGIETEADTITAIADKLKEDGWRFACQGYLGATMESSLDNNEFVADLDNWAKKTAPLVGETNLLFFPYGEEFAWLGYKHISALDHGYRFYFNLWATKEYLYVYDEYVVQSRRTLSGFVLNSYAEDLAEFFDAKSILDSKRPAFD